MKRTREQIHHPKQLLSFTSPCFIEISLSTPPLLTSIHRHKLALVSYKILCIDNMQTHT